MEVSSDDRQDGFDEDGSIFLFPTDVSSTALDCIIENVTTLLNSKIDSLRNELVAKLSQRNIVFDSEINSVFENAVVRNPFEGLCRIFQR